MLLLNNSHYTRGLADGLIVGCWSGSVDQTTGRASHAGDGSGEPALVDVPNPSREGWVST